MTDRDAWLAERNRIPGVGASDAPNLVGVGFRTADQVYREKVKPDYRPPRGRLLRGLELEAIVAAKYAEEMGVEIAKPDPSLQRHPDREWQFASIDRIRDDGRTVQLKTTAGFGEDWGAPGTDQVPLGYAVQCQHEMGVAEVDWCDLAALDVIDWELRVYRIAFNPEYFDWLTQVEHRFVYEHLIPRRPPGPDWEREIAGGPSLFVDKAVRLELGEDVAAMCARREEFAAIEKAARKEREAIEDAIKGLVGDAAEATAPGWRIKRTYVAGSEFMMRRSPSVRLTIGRSKNHAIERREQPESVRALPQTNNTEGPERL